MLTKHLMLPLLAASACAAKLGSQDVGEEVATGSWEVAPGVVVDAPRAWTVSFAEQSEDCTSPGQQGVSYAPTERSLRVGLPFAGSPYGEFPVATSSRAVVDHEGRRSVIPVDTDLLLDGTLYYSDGASGSIVISEEAAGTVARLALIDVRVVDGRGSSIEISTSIDLDLSVRCSQLPGDGSDGADGESTSSCAWIDDPFPYTSEECRELTAAFPDDVKR